jgi:hypothetical protein
LLIEFLKVYVIYTDQLPPQEDVGEVTELLKSKGVSYNMKASEWQEYLESFFNNSDLSDIVLRVGETTIPAHKVILTKADYFNSMFEVKMLESKSVYIFH